MPPNAEQEPLPNAEVADLPEDLDPEQEIEKLISEAEARPERSEGAPAAGTSPEPESPEYETYERELSEESISRLPKETRGMARRLLETERRLAAYEAQMQNARVAAEEAEEPEEEDISFEVPVPEGYEGIKPTLEALGKTILQEQRRFNADLAKLRESVASAQANAELRSWKSDHKDWQKYEDAMYKQAVDLDFFPADYKGLQALYDAVKGRELQEQQSRADRDREIQKRAGAAPRFTPTRPAMREEAAIAKGSGKRTLDDALDLALRQMGAQRRRAR